MAKLKEARSRLYLLAACVLLVGGFHLLLRRPRAWDGAGSVGSGLGRLRSASRPIPVSSSSPGSREPTDHKNTPQSEPGAEKNASRLTAGPGAQDGTSPPVLVVIVASSPRSGSSFLAELLSSPRRAVLFYEPFWYCDTNGLAITKDMHLSPDASRHGLVQRYLHHMLTCRLAALPDMFDPTQEMKIWRKPRFLAPVTLQQRTSVCRDLDLRVVKVVRPGLGSVLPLLKEPGLNVHVIHLVRDPRAIVNSVLGKENWIDEMPPSKICSSIRDDLVAARDFRDSDAISQRYTLVRYEDLTSRPEQEARRLFQRMGLTLPAEVVEFVDRHSRRSLSATTTGRPTTTPQPPRVVTGRRHWWQPWSRRPNSTRATTTKPTQPTQPTEPPVPAEVFQDYFSTIRAAQFDALHWLKELPDAERKLVENICSDLLDDLGYPLVYPQERQNVTEISIE